MTSLCKCSVWIIIILKCEFHLNRVLFIADWGTPPNIARTRMDGLGHRVIVGTALKWPNGVALDRENTRVYWIDAALKKLESASYDGRDRKIHISDRRNGLFHPYGISFFNGFVFWSNIWNSSVHQARVRNGELVNQTIIEDSVKMPAQFQIVSDDHPRPGGKNFKLP